MSYVCAVEDIMCVVCVSGTDNDKEKLYFDISQKQHYYREGIVVMDVFWR